MVDHNNRRRAEWILEQVGTVNPYNKQGENRKSEYQLYQAGYLAAYMASLMAEDPWILRRFERHVADKRAVDKGRR